MDKRQPSPIGKDEELLRKEKIDSFIESLEVKDISDILWTVNIKKCILSVLKLVEAIKSRKIRSNDFLSTWNIYDEKGTKTNKKMR